MKQLLFLKINTNGKNNLRFYFPPTAIKDLI